MDKVLVEVSLPATDRKFEVYIPLDLKFYDITFLTSKVLSELSNGLFISTEDSILCEGNTGEVLDVNMSPRELKIKNGDKLMLL